MRSSTLISICLGVLSGSGAHAASLPFDLQSVQLDNGLRLVMVRHPSPGLIAYYSMVRVGSRDEVEKGVTGFAHFFEHMMFRGTEGHPPEKIDLFLKKTGADQNGFTTGDFTCYTFFGSNAYLEELVAMEADRFQNLKYTEDVFKTESKAVLGEYNKSSSSPYLKLEERLRELSFKQHPYGHTTLGYLADIEAMPGQYEYSRKFFERYYTPDNTTIIAVGDFDPKALEGLVRKYYSGWKSKRAKTAIKAEPPQKKEIRERIAWKTPTLPLLSLSWRTPATDLSSPETWVYLVGYELIFGNATPLYTDLILERQLVESFDDWSRPNRDPGLFHAVVRVKEAKDLQAVEERIDAAVADLASGRVDPKLLDDVKSRVRYGTILGLDTPPNIATQLAFTIAPTGEINALEKYLASVEKVTMKDVQAFAKKYLQKSNRAVVALVSEEGGR
jgi:zinc protease